MNTQTEKIANVTDADDLSDAIHDFVNDNSGWEDQGIGSYEFWGARGNDTRWVYCLQNDSMKVCINDYSDDTLPYNITVKASGGGCSGEHEGHCNKSCIEWEMEVIALLLEVKTEVEFITNDKGNRIRKETKVATYSLEMK